MSIHSYDLQTCAFIQEKQTLSLENAVGFQAKVLRP